MRQGRRSGAGAIRLAVALGAAVEAGGEVVRPEVAIIRGGQRTRSVGPELSGGQRPGERERPGVGEPPGPTGVVEKAFRSGGFTCGPVPVGPGAVRRRDPAAHRFGSSRAGALRPLRCTRSGRGTGDGRRVAGAGS